MRRSKTIQTSWCLLHFFSSLCGVPFVFGLLSQRTANIILQMSENYFFRYLFLKARVGNVERLEGERGYCKYLYFGDSQ